LGQLFLKSLVYTAGPGIDSFITKYNGDGTYGWTRPLTGSTVNDSAEAFAIAEYEGNAYLTGFFIGTVDFDGTTGTANHSSDPGNFDFFLTSYTDDVPEISNLEGEDASGTGQISWTTDADSSTQVEYGLTDDYGTATAETDTSPRVIDHSQNVPSLHTCARYYYRVLSADSDGNKAISDNRTFNATGCLASSVVGGTSELLATTGGSFELTNDQSTVTLLVPSGAADEEAAYQINLLDPGNVPNSPSGTTIAKGNFFNLLAVSQSDEVITSFTDPVYFTVNYGPDTESSYQEGTLDMYKYDGSNWNRQNCTLDTEANTITCALGSFSVYGVFGQPQSSGLSPASAPHCDDNPPAGIPDLFQTNVSDTRATVYFTPTGPDSQYFVSFSTLPLAEEHGALVRLGREGVQNFTVNYLIPGKVWYFKVRAQNGCMPGKWSSIMKVTTLGNNPGSVASYYKYGPINKHIFSSTNSLTSIIY